MAEACEGPLSGTYFPGVPSNALAAKPRYAAKRLGRPLAGSIQGVSTVPASAEKPFLASDAAFPGA